MKLFWSNAWERLKGKNTALYALFFLGLLILCSLLFPLLSKHNMSQTHLPLKNLAPSFEHWFGTDELGRDVFTRIWYGARISLTVGILAALIDMFIGVFYGAYAGLRGGKVDEIMMRIADIIYAIPHLLIVILVTLVFGSGLITVILAISLTGWINMARLVRGQVREIKERNFVLAARMYGASNFRLLSRHLIPNTLATILTTMTFTIPTAIFYEAFLSFLGLGVQVPIASWGAMAHDGLSAFRYFPHRLLFPAGFISLTMLSFNLLGDALRDALDPNLKEIVDVA